MRPTTGYTPGRDGRFSGITKVLVAQGTREFEVQGTHPDVDYQVALMEPHLEKIVRRSERSEESILFPINKSGVRPTIAFTGVVGASASALLSYLGRWLFNRSKSQNTIEFVMPDHHRRIEVAKSADMTDADFDKRVREVIHQQAATQDRQRGAST